ncbi:hypothetical protein ACFSYB_06580 [Litchfieldia salsa]
MKVRCLRMQRALNIILFLVFMTGTIITVFILYNKMDTSITTTFIIGYVIFLALYGVWLIIKLAIRLKTISMIQLRKKLLTFLISFLSLSSILFVFNYFFTQTGFEIWDLSIPLGVSFGITFSDLIYKTKQEEISD